MTFVILFAVFLILFGLVSIFIGGMFFEQGDSEAVGIAGMGLILVIMSITLFTIEIGEKKYKQGQVDALSGDNIQYELKVQSDSSRVWIKKDEGE